MVKVLFLHFVHTKMMVDSRCPLMFKVELSAENILTSAKIVNLNVQLFSYTVNMDIDS